MLSQVVPGQDAWLGTLPTIRAAAALLDKDDDALRRAARTIISDPATADLPDTLLDTADYLETIALLLRTAEASLVEKVFD